MAAMRFALRRSSDDGFDTEFRTYHRCPQGARAHNDVLTFWPYSMGQGMPSGVPWVCESEHPCPACGQYVMAWFQWKTDLIL